MKTTKITAGHYKAVVKMLVDDVVKDVEVDVYKNEEGKTWYGVMSGIGQNPEYTDHYETKAQVIKSISAIKGWKYYQGLGYCITN